MMKKLKISMLLCLLLGCATRGYFPKAKSSDIIACRQYAAQFGAVWVNLEFNRCMEEAGYSDESR